MRRVRIPSEDDLKAIKDHALHELLVGDLLPDVHNALVALDQAIQEEQVSLDRIVETLAGLLPAQPKIRETVVYVDSLGGSTLDQRGLYVAIARWIVDNQIGKGFNWEASTTPEQR